MITRDELLEVLERTSVIPSDYRWAYSGRGMLGRTCFGFVGRPRQLAEFFVALGRWIETSWNEHDVLAIDVVDEFVTALTVDNMGHDYVYYFPYVDVLDEHPREFGATRLQSPVTNEGDAREPNGSDRSSGAAGGPEEDVEASRVGPDESVDELEEDVDVHGQEEILLADEAVDPDAVRDREVDRQLGV